MRTRFLSLAGLLLGTGLALAQAEPPPTKGPAADEKPPISKPEPGVPDTPPKKLTPIPTGAPPERIVPPGIFGGGTWEWWQTEGSWWSSAEALYLWTKKTNTLPPLIHGPLEQVVDPDTGEVFQGDPTVLFGGRHLDYNGFGGLRFTGGYWFDESRHLGVEASFLFLGRRSAGTRQDDVARLARPFFNLATRTEDVIIVAAPGIAAGSLAIDTTSRSWGIEANLWKNLYYEPVFKCLRIDLICGLRYLDLSESIRADRATTFAPNLIAQPRFLALQSNQLLDTDSLRVHNSFYGGQAGLAFRLFDDCFVIDLKGKVAAGVNQERVILRGEQIRVRPDGTRTTAPGSLFALPSNIGRHRREQFTFVPEANLTLGFPINNNIGLYAGYTFIYWSRVARAADQIDRVVDVTQVPNYPPPIPAATGQGRPGVPFNQSQWWAQGIHVGLEISW